MKKEEMVVIRYESPLCTIESNTGRCRDESISLL